MKKIFVVLFAFLGISLTVSAKNYATCVVEDGGGASVSVTVVDVNGKNVDVLLSSDCLYPVSIQFEIEFTIPYGNGYTWTSETITVTVPAGQDTPKTYTLKDSNGRYYEEIANIKNVKIWGARCRK